MSNKLNIIDFCDFLPQKHVFAIINFQGIFENKSFSKSCVQSGQRLTRLTNWKHPQITGLCRNIGSYLKDRTQFHMPPLKVIQNKRASVSRSKLDEKDLTRRSTIPINKNKRIVLRYFTCIE